MKKITTLCVALFATITISAQQQLATLNHNDSITVYYGNDSFVQAHNAAVDGDIITLSSGTFAAPDTINKAIIIRGAGMTADTISNSFATCISSSLSSSQYTYIHVTGDSHHHLSVEGIRFLKILSSRRLTSQAEFSKCYFTGITAQSNTLDSLNNSIFSNCIIKGLNSSKIYGNTFINCAVLGSTNLIDGCTFINCVTGYSTSSSSFYNCIIYNGGTGGSGTKCFNCIGIAPNGLFRPIVNNNQNVGNDLSQVFKTFRSSGDSYYYDENFELLDSVAMLYRGSDGTQVGMHGGPMPFDPRVGNPRIGHITVATRSTADGKLPVDIEVISE